MKSSIPTAAGRGRLHPPKAKFCMNNQFTSLVENALDFLGRSVRDLEEGDAKYSVINFYSGLELFLKARLLREHWVLCASDVNKMERMKFGAGNFESIGLKEAKDRLSNILGCGIPDREMIVYERLRKRRNQAVHFYHPADLVSEKKVAVEQLVGWHFLYPRLTSEWKDCFEPFMAQLKELHRKISSRSEYFPAIYAELRDDIQKQTRQRLVMNCLFCRQVSAVTRGPVMEDVHHLECFVCETESIAVFLPCRKCGKPAPRSFMMETQCQWCSHPHEGDLAETFAWSERKRDRGKPAAWCGACGYTVKESVTFGEAGSLCLACYDHCELTFPLHCEWCGSEVTGGVGDYWNPGCVRCQFHLEYDDSNETAPEYLSPPSEWRIQDDFYWNRDLDDEPQ
jgi:hypothetical protein